MRLSEALRHGLDRRGERAALAGCALLAGCYIVFLAAAALGGEPIDRQFARRRASARIRILAEHRLPIGRPIPLGEAGQAGTPFFLLNGWSAPEPTGVWSVAPLAEVEVMLPMTRPSDLKLSFTATLNLTDQQPAPISVTIGQSRYDLDAPGAILSGAGLAIPAGAIGADGSLVVGFGSMPRSISGGSDPRSVGLKLQSLEVD